MTIPESGIECLDQHKGDCDGDVEFRMSLSPSGRPFPRCDKHWSDRLDEQERINSTYPALAPAGFDYLDVGEHWGEDEY